MKTHNCHNPDNCGYCQGNGSGAGGGSELYRDSVEESLQIIKGVTYYVEYPVKRYEFDKMAGKVIVGSYENPIEILSKRDVEVFNATSKMIWGKVEKNITALLKQTNNNTTKE